MRPSKRRSPQGENKLEADNPASIPPHASTPAVVTLTIPSAPEYVGTARLTILGVAGRMGFSYDQVEDIRLAVGEACTNAIERAARRNGSAPDVMISIRSHVEPSRLVIEVEEESGGPEQDPGSAPAGIGGPAVEAGIPDGQELGALLMEILVDEVVVEPLPGGGTRVRLIKFTTEA